MMLRRAKAGVFCDKPMWIFTYGPYLHLSTNLFRLLYQVLTEFKDDKHLVGQEITMTPHPKKICDVYPNTDERCPECMTLQEEVDFWHECYNGKHSSPEDCPTWYDWCNCGVTLFETIEHLQGVRDGLKRELKEAKADFKDQLRFMWKEYVLCNEDELTEDAKALRAELLDCIKG